MSVERDDIACADHYAVSGTDLVNSHEHLVVLRGLHPRPVNIQVHAPRQIIHRLLVCPLFEQAAHIQQEHDGSGSRIISSDKRYRDRRRIQDRDLHAAPAQAVQALADIPRGLAQAVQTAERNRQKDPPQSAADHQEKQLVLIGAAQFPPCMCGYFHFGALITEIRERLNDRSARFFLLII